MGGVWGGGGSGGLMVVSGGKLVEDLTRNRVTCVAECPEVGPRDVYTLCPVFFLPAIH